MLFSKSWAFSPCSAQWYLRFLQQAQIEIEGRLLKHHTKLSKGFQRLLSKIVSVDSRY